MVGCWQALPGLSGSNETSNTIKHLEQEFVPRLALHVFHTGYLRASGEGIAHVA